LNELVWSPILAFPERTSPREDADSIQRKVTALRKQYNSHNELNDAQMHLARREVKPAIRLAAPAAEASIKYYAAAWGVLFPPAGTRKLSFIEKVDSWLTVAGKPTYSSSDPQNAEYLQHLYSSRNAMHEADCYYKRANGSIVEVKSQEQATPLVEAAVAFVVWLDALV